MDAEFVTLEVESVLDYTAAYLAMTSFVILLTPFTSVFLTEPRKMYNHRDSTGLFSFRQVSHPLRDLTLRTVAKETSYNRNGLQSQPTEDKLHLFNQVHREDLGRLVQIRFPNNLSLPLYTL